jgi:hypothetical protein
MSLFMNRIKLISAAMMMVLAFAACATAAPSQVETVSDTFKNQGESKIGLGIQAGVRFEHDSETWGLSDILPGIDNTGFYASLYGMYAFTPSFSLQTGLAFSFNDGFHDSEWYGYIHSIKLSVLDIPVLSVFTQRPLQNVFFRFRAGPLFTVALTDLEHTIQALDGPSRTFTEPLDNMLTLGFLLGFGVGYSTGKGNIVFDIHSFIDLPWYYGRGNSWFIRYGLPLVLLGYEYWF